MLIWETEKIWQALNPIAKLAKEEGEKVFQQLCKAVGKNIQRYPSFSGAYHYFESGKGVHGPFPKNLTSGEIGLVDDRNRVAGACRAEGTLQYRVHNLLKKGVCCGVHPNIADYVLYRLIEAAGGDISALPSPFSSHACEACGKTKCPSCAACDCEPHYIPAEKEGEVRLVGRKFHDMHCFYFHVRVVGFKHRVPGAVFPEIYLP